MPATIPWSHKRSGYNFIAVVNENTKRMTLLSGNIAVTSCLVTCHFADQCLVNIHNHLLGYSQSAKDLTEPKQNDNKYCIVEPKDNLLSKQDLLLKHAVLNMAQRKVAFFGNYTSASTIDVDMVIDSALRQRLLCFGGESAVGISSMPCSQVKKALAQKESDWVTVDGELRSKQKILDYLEGTNW